MLLPLQIQAELGEGHINIIEAYEVSSMLKKALSADHGRAFARRTRLTCLQPPAFPDSHAYAGYVDGTPPVLGG